MTGAGQGTEAPHDAPAVISDSAANTAFNRQRGLAAAQATAAGALVRRRSGAADGQLVRSAAAQPAAHASQRSATMFGFFQ